MIRVSVRFFLAMVCACAIGQGQTLISQGATATASSAQGGNTADKTVDNSLESRWESRFGTGVSDTQWIMIDLGNSRVVDLVEIVWETASASDYQVQLSNDPAFAVYELIGAVRGGNGGTDSVVTDNVLTGRYVRIYMTRKNTGYGYSIFELRLFDLPANRPVAVGVRLPYAQFLRIALDPPAVGGLDLLQLQNRPLDTVLTFMQGTQATFTIVEKRGENDLRLFALKRDTVGGEVNGALTTSLYDGLLVSAHWIAAQDTANKAPTANPGPNRSINFSQLPLVLDGSKSSDADGSITAWRWEQVAGPHTLTIQNPDAAIATVVSAPPGDYAFRLAVTDDKQATHSARVYITVVLDRSDFTLTFPIGDTVMTASRGLQLRWEAAAGASRYEIWMNVTKDSYDWYGMGNLLDQYTRIGESTTNSFTLTSDLQERWTYRWYVIATTATTQLYSDRGVFAIYNPVVETEADNVGIVNGSRDLNKNGTIEPFENWRLPVGRRLDDLMGRLSTAQKVKQLFYGGEEDQENGFSFSWGNESDMLAKQKLASATTAGIPVAFLGDKINGWKNIFPTHLGIAATRDPQIAWACGNVQRREHRFGGFTGTLAPLAEVNTKVLYPRFQEGWGENADDAAALLKAMIVGMQGGPELNPHSMLITIKHWPSQGAGGESALQYDARTIDYHMKPWVAAVEANAPSVMPGYNTCPYLDPAHGANSSAKVIDYLRNEIGFKGFVVTDWLAANTAQSIESLGAGIDVMGGAPSSLSDVPALAAAIGMDRVNESCRRILDVKMRMGLFENPYGDASCAWTHEEHHAVCLNAARKSITLLENNGVLPLKAGQGDVVVVTGPRAIWPNKDNNPMAVWQSIYYDDPDAMTFLEAIQARSRTAGNTVQFVDTAEVAAFTPGPSVRAAVVVIGERSYTHGTEWADKNPHIPPTQKALIERFHTLNVPVICVVVSPRPYILTDIKGLVAAMLFVYRGGTAMPQATAELIFGDFEPGGLLPFQLPQSIHQIGTDNVSNQLERWELPYDLGATEVEREQIRTYMEAGLKVPTTFGDPLYPYGFGYRGFSGQSAVKTPDRTVQSLRCQAGIKGRTLSITASQPLIRTVRVYDVRGRIAFDKSFAPAQTLNIMLDRTMAKGSYFIELLDGARKPLLRQTVVIVR